MVSSKPVIVPIGCLQDETTVSQSSRSELKGRGVTEAWPKLAEVKEMIPYSRTEGALVYCEVLGADIFASETVKVGNYWPTISSFWIVGHSFSSGESGYLNVNGQWA